MKIVFSALIFLSGISLFAQQQPNKPALVQKPVYFDVSPPMRDMVIQPVQADVTWKNGIVMNYFDERNHNEPSTQLPGFTDPLLQALNGTIQSDTTIQNFEGLGAGPYIPPDTDGDVGPNHYFQVVNASYAIYSKGGDKLFGPIGSSNVWNGMPNNSNDGDAVVLYDENADRWLFTQFSLPNYPNGPFFQMIAVSQTPDPTGSWYRYQYSFNSMPDYPKFGVWPDGYYMSCNRFGPGSGGYAGTGASAFNRAKMLAGDPTAEMVYFEYPASNEAFSLLPSDCDGSFPPSGTPNYFTYERENPPHLGILEFHADWTNPSNSTLGNLLSVPVTSFNSNLGSGIPQLGTSAKLATLSDRLMFRLQFRKFSDHWSMVCNHSVNAGSNVAGIRWYELRKTSGAWTLYQESTFAPADNISRWMGSIAMDSAGNIGIGYSASGNSLYPSIRYTGRMKTDPLNQMTISERRIMDGGGCQTSSSKRWGDYSSIRIDPTSPTTFWYTTEYYSMTSSSSWQTRIASFTFLNVFSTSATAAPNRVCMGDSSQLNAIAYGGSGNYTYSWTSIPPGFSSNLRNPKVVPSDTTTYIVAVSDGILTYHDTTGVMTLVPAVSFAGADTTVCSNLTSTDLHGTASNYNAIAWATGGNGHFSSTSSLNTTYSFGSADYQNGSVDLLLFAFPISPCSGNAISTRHVILDPCNGIPEPGTDEPELVLQPNPASESVEIGVRGISNETGMITITSMNGQIVRTIHIIPSSGSFSKQIDLHDLPAGTYMIRAGIGRKTLSKQLVIH